MSDLINQLQVYSNKLYHLNLKQIAGDYSYLCAWLKSVNWVEGHLPPHPAGENTIDEYSSNCDIPYTASYSLIAKCTDNDTALLIITNIYDLLTALKSEYTSDIETTAIDAYINYTNSIITYFGGSVVSDSYDLQLIPASADYWTISSSEINLNYSISTDSTPAKFYFLHGQATGEGTWSGFTYELTEAIDENGNDVKDNLTMTCKNNYGYLQIWIKSSSSESYNIKSLKLLANPVYNCCLYFNNSSWQTNTVYLYYNTPQVFYAYGSNNIFTPDDTWDFENAEPVAFFSGGTYHEINTDLYDRLNDISFGINDNGQLTITVVNGNTIMNVCGLLIKVGKK